VQNLKRVVITGIGVVTSLGNSLDEFFQNLIEGKSGIDFIRGFDTRDFAVKIGGEVRNFDPAPFISPKDLQRMDRFCQFGVVAAMLAYVDA